MCYESMPPTPTIKVITGGNEICHLSGVVYDKRVHSHRGPLHNTPQINIYFRTLLTFLYTIKNNK